jgi:hypothetical protein
MKHQLGRQFSSAHKTVLYVKIMHSPLVKRKEDATKYIRSHSRNAFDVYNYGYCTHTHITSWNTKYSSATGGDTTVYAGEFQ